ncbi:MAG: hypothetical protein LPK45_00240, partial [Bacteroidota bacterium]|nr:hypothetical protein [Bacteroidota bacterium]MDX5429448.1 hypothetical protein [Bacteroidota bacterium]MDX5468240.1 hypothetical protein [Bacteroidota bacterium]
MKQWILFLLFFTVLQTSAQEKRLLKAQELYAAEQPEKALKQIKKVLQHKETKNSPQAHLLQAKIWLALQDDPEYPKALLDALKSAEKALRKTKTPEELKAEESDFFQQLIDASMQAAEADLSNARFIQSDKYYSKLYELFGYLPAQWGQAQIALALKDSITAIRISRDLVSQLSTVENPSASLSHPGPYALLVEHQIQQKQYDSASFYAQKGFDQYPNHAAIKGLLLKSFLLFVTQSKPDLKTLELFAHMRPIFRNDSLFIHKENVLFLYLMNRYSAGDEHHIADSVLAGFVQIKNDYYAEFGEDYRRKDPIYNPDNNAFLFNLIRYTAKHERIYMMAMLLDNYVSGNYADSAFKASTRPGRWKGLFERVLEEKSIFL